MHAKYDKADELRRLAIGAAIIEKLNLIARAAQSMRPQSAFHPRSIRG